MRTLADRKNEQAKADADDRELESRTDRRRQQDAHETMLKGLATRLCNMKSAALDRLGLDEESLAAIRTAQSIRSAPARNRQINVVRQHLRALGPALDVLVRQLDAPARFAPSPKPAAPARQASPELSLWSERLAEGGDESLAEFLGLYPAADRQQLRQRMRELARSRAGASSAAIAASEARLASVIAAALNGNV